MPPVTCGVPDALAEIRSHAISPGLKRTMDFAGAPPSDLVVELGLPDAAARARILAVALADLAVAWPELKDLASKDALHVEPPVRTAG